jgi:N-acetylated-alpha-linked acidic dipeptidase
VGIINGTSPDEVIVIGNHRDAWLIGGAADPNSGSAVLVELAKAFGKLQKTGWKPKRTIVLCSWDAEEYGLVGSVEWVEEFVRLPSPLDIPFLGSTNSGIQLPWLKATNVAYLNIDVAVSGPIPDITATPQLHKIATDIMRKIIYPYKGSTVYLYPVSSSLPASR